MKKIYRGLKENSGSMTVEASLLFPLIILSIIAVIYICIILYQQAYLQSVANRVAERGAICWDNIYKMDTSSNVFRLETGELKSAEELINKDLYWRITGAKENKKIENLKLYTIDKLKKNSILEGNISKLDIDSIENNEIDIFLKDYIVYKELNVILTDSYKIPLGSGLKVFGLSDKYNIKVYSKVLINDETEFIRNADFIGDTLKEYEVTSEFINKFKETMGKVTDNIEEFFEDIGGT